MNVPTNHPEIEVQSVGVVVAVQSVCCMHNNPKLVRDQAFNWSGLGGVLLAVALRTLWAAFVNV